ncbi:MAG: archease [Bacteroidota bacterium]|nr:archease [Bacteroidota bacterium]
MNGEQTLDIGHTADFGIHVSGPTVESVFTHAAEAMFAFMLEGWKPPEGVAGIPLHVEICASSPEELFREWLAELLYHASIRRAIAARFRITSLTGTRLSADAELFPIKPRDRRRTKEVKAVTWHGLRLERNDDGWEAEVIFDT